MDKSRLYAMADSLEQDIVAFRHELHKIPELAGEEKLTSEKIRSELKKLPVKILPSFLGTDVVAEIQGGRPGKHILLRADIDALPIVEKNTDLPYCSTHPGKMHACGHDAHTAMLLGTARMLCAVKDELCGTVRLVFQPGEECAAMGKDLVKAGVLKNPEMDFVAAIHVYPGIRTGVVSGRIGAIFSGGGSLEITLRRECKNSVVFSEDWIDMNVIASQMVDFFRKNWPAGSQIRFSRFNSEGESPYIPDKVTVFAPISTQVMESDAAIRKLVAQAEKMFHRDGMGMTIDYQLPYLPTINQERNYRFAMASAKDTLGEENFVTLDAPGAGSEDFSFYLNEKPGIYFFIGNGSDIWLHEDVFNADDKLIKNGMLFLAGLAVDFLNTGKTL